MTKSTEREDLDELVEGEEEGGEQEESPARGRPNYLEHVSAAELEELQPYGVKVKRRVAKAIYQRNIERDERLRLEEENRRLKEENAGFKHQAESAQYQGMDARLASQESELNAQLEQAQSDYQAALDEGDTKKASEINAKIARLGGKLGVVEEQKAAHKARGAPKEPETKGGAAAQQESRLSPASRAWLEQNAGWFKDTKNARAIRRAQIIESELYEEGYRLDDPDTYAELDRRLDKEVKDMDKIRGRRAQPDGDEEEEEEERGRQPARRAASPVGGPSDSRGPTDANKRPGRFTERDADNMRRFGKDPNDMKQREAWMKYKGR